MHWKLGNGDIALVVSLPAGSIQGGFVGSDLSSLLPVAWLERILCTILLASGAKMLWG